jgi:hypothetical protein
LHQVADILPAYEEYVGLCEHEKLFLDRMFAEANAGSDEQQLAQWVCIMHAIRLSSLQPAYGIIHASDTLIRYHNTVWGALSITRMCFHAATSNGFGLVAEKYQIFADMTRALLHQHGVCRCFP